MGRWHSGGVRSEVGVWRARGGVTGRAIERDYESSGMDKKNLSWPKLIICKFLFSRPDSEDFKIFPGGRSHLQEFFQEASEVSRVFIHTQDLPT
jgi:hypothetical protein